MKVKQLLGKPVRTEQEQNCKEFCLPKCYIGLEYEWERTQNWPGNDEFNQYFIAHNDGSLRNYGREFVFNGPLSGTHLLKAITLMDEAARAAKFEASYRTSLHCHMDMSEMNFPDDLHILGTLYCIVEPFLYKFVGQNRDACNYSIPWYCHPQHYEVFLKAIKNNYDSPTKYGSSLVQSKQFKYSGLNFFSLGEYGSIEWRQAPVNMQKDKIIKWINLIMRHKKFVMEHRTIVPDWLVTYATRRGPQEFLAEVFSEDYKDLIKFSSRPAQDFQTGLATAYHFLTILKGAE